MSNTQQNLEIAKRFFIEVTAALRQLAIWVSNRHVKGQISQKAAVLRNFYDEADQLKRGLIATAQSMRQRNEGSIMARFHTDEGQSQQRINHALRETDELISSELEIAGRSFSNALSEISGRSKAVMRSLGNLGKEFSNESWDEYVPPMDFIEKTSTLTRLGELSVRGENITLRLPALVPIIGGKHVVFKASGLDLDLANRALQCILLRLLTVLYAGQLRFHLIDPVGLGANMAGFLNLPSDMIGGKVLTETSQIESGLAQISEHMEMIVQNCLRNRHENIEAHNRQAGEMKEAYHIIAICNFPANFTERSAHHLVNISVNGPRTGVYLIMSIDKSKPMPPALELSEFEQTGTIIESLHNGFFWQNG